MFSFKFILEIFMVVCWGIVAFSLIMLLIEKLGKASNFGETSVETLNIKKTKVCQLVLEWCHENIGHNKTVKPRLEVIYYKNKKVSGSYFSGYHLCKIYVNNHRNIRELTNTVIHEYVHARQRDKNFNKLYDKYHTEVGYDKNPFEVEARNVASKYENECLEWLKKQIAA
jgi:hypothetical protein